MEQMYRGYPQVFAQRNERVYERQVEATNVVPQPYMIYNRENQPLQTAPWDDRWRIQAEWDYFRGLYPLEAKRLQSVVEAEFDRIDQDGGPMYDEYPDREFLYQVRDVMFAKALSEGIAADRDLLQVLLLQDLLNRRMRRRKNV